MLKTLQTIALQKNQLIKDIRTREIKPKFRGIPVIDKEKLTNLEECQNACPLNAITKDGKIDLGRYGVEFVASPRHADGIVITGPVSKNMAKALEDTLLSTPEPRIIIAVGACAISGGIYADSEEIDRDFFKKYPPDLYIPGCPAHPLTIINGILDYLGCK